MLEWLDVQSIFKSNLGVGRLEPRTHPNEYTNNSRPPNRPLVDQTLSEWTLRYDTRYTRE